MICASAFEFERKKKSAVVYAARVLLRQWQWDKGSARGDYIDVGYGWKIGFTVHLHSRVIGLVGSARDVELVAATHATRDDETAIHRRLSRHALSAGPSGCAVAAREWYPDVPEVRATIDDLSFRWRGSIRLLAVERSPDRVSGYCRDGDYSRALRDVIGAWRSAIGADAR